VHTGDLLFHGRHPFVDRSSGATTTGWQESLRRVLTLCDASTVVVPGHGPLGTRDAIQAQIDYFDRIRAHVQGMVKTGTTRQAVAESKPAGLERYEGSPAIALVAVFEELTGVAPG